MILCVLHFGMHVKDTRVNIWLVCPAFYYYYLGFKVVFHHDGDLATGEVGGRASATCRMIHVYKCTTKLKDVQWCAVKCTV